MHQYLKNLADIYDLLDLKMMLISLFIEFLTTEGGNRNTRELFAAAIMPIFCLLEL